MGLHPSFYDLNDKSFIIIMTCMPSDMNYQTLGLYNYVSSVHTSWLPTLMPAK